MSPTRDYEVLIIGAGVLGVSLAYHLGQKGVSCAVLERESSYATHASGKNAGMFRQLYHHPQLTDWAKRSRENWPKEIFLNAFVETGSVIMGRTSPSHNQELFTQTEKDVVYTKTDGLIDPGSYVATLFELTKNVSFYFKEEVQNLSLVDIGKPKWKAETKSGAAFFANNIVNASGAWLNKFHTLKVKAEPYARHLCLVAGFKPDEMPAKSCGYFWDEGSNWYLRIWDKDSRLVSVCDMESANPDNFSPRKSVLEDIAERLESSFPESYDSLHVKSHWHCFRTYTSSKLPLWGYDPRKPGFFWLAAFGGYGMSTSFAAAMDAADCLAQGKGTPQLFHENIAAFV